MAEVKEFYFPKNFRWGTATSSYQVEGNIRNNDWFAAEREGGYVFEDQTAGAACDWWNSAEEDFDRMMEMNTNAHRLSIEWSRIQPHPDQWDEDAILRYREMIRHLRERGIEPMVTLHHFTNPLWMTEMGGWENERSPIWFEVYVRRVVNELSDMVNIWCTINEPMVMIGQSYLVGYWPPGEHSLNKSIQVWENLIKGHAAAYHAIHEIQPHARVGIAKHMVIWHPHRFWLPTDQLFSQMVNRVTNIAIVDAVTEGVLRIPFRRPYRFPQAANTLDWLGVNYYQRYRVGIKLWDMLKNFIPGFSLDILHMGTKPGLQKGPGEWGEIHPEGLYQTLRAVRSYNLPIYITENGIPDQDDEYRPAFILSHLQQLWRAMKDGLKVLGYYHWSLVDNFEWSMGYDPRFRFGLIEVDFDTQQRRWRKSGRLFAQICGRGGINTELASELAPEAVSAVFPKAGKAP